MTLRRSWCVRALAVLVLLLPLGAQAQLIEPAPEYENLFRRTEGWTGADGTYSYPLGQDQTLWGFSDTFLGQVVNGARQEPWGLEHNSMVWQNKSSINFLPAPLFTPPNRNTWFWLFDAAESGDILLGEFAGDGDDTGFGFHQVGLWTARFHLRHKPDGPQVQVTALQRLPYFAEKPGQLITFGPAILETPSWTYLYGALDKDGARHSVLARVPRGLLAQAGAWRFFDGQGWTTDLWSAKPLFAGAAMEASVHRTASGQYLYLGTDAGGMGTKIVARLSSTPQGPWGEPVTVFSTPEHQGDVFTYNAKAHPELSRDGRLLISYNVNTSDFAKNLSNADIYRPRFFWWTPPEPGWLP